MAKQKHQWHNGCATLTKCSSLYFASFHVQIDNEKNAKSTFKPSLHLSLVAKLWQIFTSF